MKAAADSGHPTKAVILLQISEQEVWQRYEQSKARHDRGNRSDDQGEALKTRLKKFRDKTVPVIEFYRELGLLHEIDGTLPRDSVTNEIISSLLKLSSK